VDTMLCFVDHPLGVHTLTDYNHFQKWFHSVLHLVEIDTEQELSVSTVTSAMYIDPCLRITFRTNME
jgi:hypothetical protein